jgi:serine/threonine-protein kinase RsbW
MLELHLTTSSAYAEHPRRLHAEATLPVDAASVSRARRLLDEWPDGPKSEVARLVVSELVGNQVLHGATDGDLSVSIREGRDGLCVEVDGPAGATVPTKLPHDARRLSGRGLAIVDHVCNAWGWDSRRGRTRVWGVIPPAGC